MAEHKMQRKKFAREFVKDFNATQAAIRAGYSKRTATPQGSRLLTYDDVQAEVARLQRRSAAKAEVDVDRIVDEISRVAFATMADVASWGADGIVLRESSDLGDAVSAVAEVTESSDPSGNKLVRIKLHNKLQALERLGKHLGMFSEKVEVKVQGALEEILERIEPQLSPEVFSEVVSAIGEAMGFEELDPESEGEG